MILFYKAKLILMNAPRQIFDGVRLRLGSDTTRYATFSVSIRLVNFGHGCIQSVC